MAWIIYSDTKVIRKTSSDEFSVSIAAGENYYVADTFPDYSKDELEIVNGVIQVKSTVQADRAAAANDHHLAALRGQRSRLLASSDWTQSPDSPLTDAKKTEWATYRQALRDLPANTTDPSNPTWPSKPS